MCGICRRRQKEVMEMFRELLEKKKITAYRLAKKSGVPYATISD